MSITFNHTIIHVLDLGLGMPVLSTDFLILDDETEAFITKHLIKLFENSATTRASFNEGAELPQMLQGTMTDEHFYNLSCYAAEKYYAYMHEYDTIPSGDLIICHFMLHQEAFVSLLKLNYKEAFTHHVENHSQGVCTKIIKHRSIFPPPNKQIEEGVIINLATEDIHLFDQSKGHYLALLLDATSALSLKETLKVVEKVTEEVIETHYDNKLAALSELKNNITETLFETQTLPLEDVLEKTFGDDPEVYKSCMNKLEEYGVTETTLEISDNKLTNKFTSQRIKTDTGIELKFPASLFKNADYIEFITAPDGTLSIVLKNISQIIPK